jgi:hypothetical protein
MQCLLFEEQQQQTVSKIADLKSAQIEKFIGKSGKYYLLNTFTRKQYAVYKSEKDLSIATGWLGYVTLEEAAIDYRS